MINDKMEQDVTEYSQPARQPPPKEPQPAAALPIFTSHRAVATATSRGAANDTNKDDEMNDTINALKSKISWAKTELVASNSATYCIELCQLIKSACEAITSIEKLNF